ncbi:MAG: hypothetical protein JXA20_18690 [Spirochaetes bacterium]|nr:hypothetical protein [Spirochaetota bacterium]
MIISIILILLVISFLFHVYFLIKYITLRQSKYLNLYLNTTVSNLIITGLLIFISLKYPSQVRSVNLKVLFWLITGILLVLTLRIKIGIFSKIYKRAQDPENFHYNFFGKKVLHTTVVKPVYIFVFFATMPFFLFAGAYFVARLINIILYGHL